MADHPPSWPRCACERCFAAAARAVIGDALPAIMASAFSPPPAAPPVLPARPRAPARRKPVHRRRTKTAAPAPEVVQPKVEPPLVVAPQVDDVPPPEPIARPRRGRPPGSKNKPKVAAAPIADRDVKPVNVPPPPPISADQVDEPAPERTCRVCGETEPTSWAQADLCSSMTCIGVAARNGREVAAARKAPAAARAKRLGRIAKLAGRRDRFAAQAERAELGADDGDEDLVERIDRIPEVAVDA